MTREYNVKIRLPPGDDEKGSIRRLRAWLKRLLRSHNVRCLEIAPADKPKETKK